MHSQLVKFYLPLIMAASLTLPASHITADQIIDQSMAIQTVSQAGDLLIELQTLAQHFADDPSTDHGIGINLTKATPTILYFRGTTVSTLAMTLPLLPGSLTDTTTLRGQIAARLKIEVTNYLLNAQYWDWEHATSTGAPYVTPANPRIPIIWHHRWQVGPHWEKMHALWAYAYYTGDWATIQSNWSFIRDRYLEGYKGTDSQQRSQMTIGGIGIFRNAANDLANGLIGYVRMAERLNDPTAPQARVEARAALTEVLKRLDISWANAPVTIGWDNTPQTTPGEWTPGYNLTPELGRWINDQARSVAQRRLDEAADSKALHGHWWTGYVNNVRSGTVIGNEDLWGASNLSHELFLGHAWMLQESTATLRQVTPWHSIMGSTPEYQDMLYIRSLFALITRQANITWVRANP